MKKIVLTMGAIFTASLILGGCGAGQNSSDQQNQSGGAQNQVTVSADTQLQSSQTDWNMQDTNVDTNGNPMIAAEKLKSMSPDSLKKQAQEVPAASVMKTPWKFYGKIVKLSGEVGIAQGYPPGSDVSKLFGGGEAGEFVLMNEDSTIIDYIHSGTTENINVGDKATVYGFPVGIGDVDNKLGGKTQQLIIIGKYVEKQK